MGTLDCLENAAHFPQFGLARPSFRLFTLSSFSLTCIHEACCIHVPGSVMDALQQNGSS